ncbi:PBP1A family penicillin-binding protein [Sporolactobacillus sp. THM7-7]|nr:PBP1A family penicillin-binding protein [Sporolactobacillus sp. THM7-7]
MVEYHSRMERRRALEEEKQRTQEARNRHTKKSGSGGGKKRGWVKRVLIILLLAVLFFILAGSITVLAIIKNAPALNTDNLRDPISSVIYDKNGKKATNVYTGENRMYTKINAIPKVVQDAFISTEDVRFYKHIGIDPIRIGGAGVAQFTKGFKSEGASTITQQVVRASFLTQDKTFSRKIQEAYLAIQLEKHYTKKQILEMYLNKIYLGGGPTYGVSAASEKYFGTNIRNATLPQAAMLAAMTRNPGYYDPVAHPDRAKERRDLVLDLMAENKAITPDQAAEAKRVSIKEMTKGHHEIKESTRKYSAFVNYVHDVLVKKEKIVTEQEFETGGLKIYTTLDPSIQKQTEKILNNKSNYPNVQKNFKAGVSIIDTQSGAIRALGGDRNYRYGNTNWAVSQDNSIGSTAKPIIDYGPAIEYLNWPTSQTVHDEPTTYTQPGSEGVSVGNWDGRYYGSMSMRRALYLSRNVPAVRTLMTLLDSQNGENNVMSFANKLGFDFHSINQSDAIGPFSSSPLQMSGAYASFGNSGIYNEPYAVTKIVRPNGDVVELNHERHVAMHDYTAYMITDMLKDVMTKGTGINANIPGAPVAGKTGTQNISDAYAKQYGISAYDQNHGATDAWFVGYTSRLTAAVWTGYYVDKNRMKEKNYGTFLGANEQKYSQSIFKNIMSDFMPGSPDFQRPASVVALGNGELGVRNSQAVNIYEQKQNEAAQKAMEEAKKKKEKEEEEKKEEEDEISESSSESSGTSSESESSNSGESSSAESSESSAPDSGSTTPGTSPGSSDSGTRGSDSANQTSSESSGASQESKPQGDTPPDSGNQSNNRHSNPDTQRTPAPSNP